MGENGDRGMKCRKRTVVVMVILISAVALIYMVYFRHPPPEEILAANSRSSILGDIKLFNDGLDELRRDTITVWDKWVTNHKYVIIGEYYSNCGKL